ncbi:hypothetical protein C8N37_106433 [Sphingobacterium faecium]|nr:hypothetical protein C8N37_106433 [Sphingobacterium faecium]
MYICLYKYLVLNNLQHFDIAYFIVYYKISYIILCKAVQYMT